MQELRHFLIIQIYINAQEVSEQWTKNERTLPTPQEEKRACVEPLFRYA